MNVTALCKGLLTFVSLVSIALLTACASDWSEEQSSARLYQPSYLILQPGQTIQTPTGLYTPQIKETWVSSAKYDEIEQENLMLIEAVRKLQSEKLLNGE